MNKYTHNEFKINHALIVVDKYWDGNVNSILHFVGYENAITDEDKHSFTSELANPQEEWTPIVDLEKQNLKVIEAPKNVIEHFKNMLKEK